MSRSPALRALAALFLLGGCEGGLPPDAPSALVGQQAGLGGLDLSARDVVASCEATALTLSATIQNEGPTGLAESTAAVYAGAPGAGGTRLGLVKIPFLVGREAFGFQLSLTVPEGTTQVFVVADEDGIFVEDDEANNVAAFLLPAPCVSNGPPMALCQDVTVAADASCQALASVDHGSFDPDGFPGAFSTVQLPAGPYFPGTTPVSLQVSDGAATATCAATVTVVDTLAPVPGASRGLVLTPSAGSDYVWVSLADCVKPATDNCGGTLDVQQAGTLTRISSDEQDDALSLLRLLACNDIQLSADRKSALVRAEAALLGNGRVYTFTYEVRDGAGNAATGTCDVRVPALLGQPAVDSGPAFCQGTGCPRGTTDHGLLCSLL
jgi:hypothetical protein